MVSPATVLASATPIVLIALIGVGATAGSFYAVYDGPNRSQLAILAFGGATLVGASPFLTLWLGANSEMWLRGVMMTGLVTFFAGLLIFAISLVMARRWIALASVLPMLPLGLWSFLLLGFFASGV